MKLRYRPASTYGDILPDLRKIGMAILRDDDPYADSRLTEIKQEIRRLAAGLDERRKQLEIERLEEDGLPIEVKQ